MLLSSDFRSMLLKLSPAFTRPTFNTFNQLVCGAVMARLDTVTGMILGADLARSRHHCGLHRLFPAAAWSLDTLGLLVFSLIEPFGGEGSVLLAGDDTLARERELEVFGVGILLTTGCHRPCADPSRLR